MERKWGRQWGKERRGEGRGEGTVGEEQKGKKEEPGFQATLSSKGDSGARITTSLLTCKTKKAPRGSRTRPGSPIHGDLRTEAQ